MDVEIWSDVVCPFCYIGKRRFERALAASEHREAIRVLWRSFELDPHAPTEQPGPLDQMLARKYGVSLEQAREMNARVVRSAAGEGLEFRLSVARRGNTFDAHRLIHLASEQGAQAEAKERLLRAYFTEGRAIGDRNVLVEIAGELGLDAELARTALEGDEYAAAVRADERRAHDLGIRGVPFFVLGGRYGVSGAQEVSTFGEALAHAWAEVRGAGHGRQSRQPAT